MKLTTEQQQFLKKYLRENLSYRETYIEFYDHILSALEAKPQTMSFQDAVEALLPKILVATKVWLLLKKDIKRQFSKKCKKSTWNMLSNI